MIRPRSLAVTALGATLLFGAAVAPISAAGAFVPSGAVNFKVDDDARTITATVQIAFWNRSCDAGTSCPVPAADAKRIVKDIEDMWNTGHKVRCYTFKVEVNAREVASQDDAGQHEVDVGLDYGPDPVKPFVTATHANTTEFNYLSNSPDNRVLPGHDPANPTTWPANTWMQAYAHEFGHILGLDDNYLGKGEVPFPGAPEDLMFRKQGYVTDEMVKRVVDRSGTVKESQLKCGWTYSDVTPLGPIKGKKCDAAGGDWTLKGEQKLGGQVTLSTLWNVTIDAKTLAGTYKYESIQGAGPTTTIGNSKGKATIVLNDDGSATMTLASAAITSKVTLGGITKTIKLPAQGWTYVWKPAGESDCPNG